MMSNFNENKRRAGSLRAESTVGQRRAAVVLALFSLVILGIPLATGQLAPLGLQQPTVSADTYRNTRLSTHLPTHLRTQAPPAAAAPAGDIEILTDFVEDGLEFTMAAVELTSPFASYKKIGHALSWLAQDIDRGMGTGE